MDSSLVSKTNTNSGNKRKRVKKGILGYPKKNNILFIINNNGINSYDQSSTSDDDENDMDYLCESKEASSMPSTPIKKARNDTNSRNSRSLMRKSRSMTTALLNSKSTPKKSLSTKEEIYLNDNDTNWCDGLPYEILLNIFNFYAMSLNGNIKELDNIRMVCKYWSNVANDGSLWKNVALNKMFATGLTNENNCYNSNLKVNTKENQKNLVKFERNLATLINKSIDNHNQNKFQFIVKLNLSYLCFLTCDLLESILSKCNSNILDELALAHCIRIDVSKRDLYFEEVIADNCSRLSTLNLTGLEKINVKSATYMFTKLGESLLDINLSQTNLSGQILHVIFENCGSIHSLDISNSNIKGVLNIDLFIDKCSKLKTLKMLKCFPKIKYTTIESVIASKTGFFYLEDLYLAFEQQFGTNQMILLLTKICKDSLNLKTIDIRSYKSPLNSFLNVFDLISTNKLERLFLCNSIFSEADSIYFSTCIFERWSTTLVELDLSWSNISKISLELIFESFIKNSSECKLKYLNLTGTCVDNQMILKLVQKLKTIKVLNLTSCRSIERGMKKTLSNDDIFELINS